MSRRQVRPRPEATKPDWEIDSGATETADTNDGCLFFTMLPTEIRRMVYFECFKGMTDPDQGRTLITVPLYVCRRMYFEAIEPFYSHSVFKLDHFGRQPTLPMRIGCRNASFIRSVELDRLSLPKTAWRNHRRRSTEAPELQRSRLRRWLENIKRYFPNVQRLRLDFRFGVLSFWNPEMDPTGGRDAVVEVLRCIYRTAVCIGFRVDQLEILVADWVLGANTPQDIVHKKVMGWVYKRGSDRFMYPCETHHAECPICAGINQKSRSTNKPGAPSVPSKIRRVSTLESLPAPVLLRIFIHVAGLDNEPPLSSRKRHPIVRIREKNRALEPEPPVRWWHNVAGDRWYKDKLPPPLFFPLHDMWWYNKFQDYRIPGPYEGPLKLEYKEHLRRVTLTSLMRLGRTSRRMYKKVIGFFNDPIFNEVRFVFESSTAAVAFLELMSSSSDDSPREFGALSPNNPAYTGRLKIPVRHVVLPLRSRREVVRGYWIFKLQPPDEQEMLHMRIAIASLIKHPSLKSLRVLASPDCIPLVHSLGPKLLENLHSLSEPDIDTVIAGAYKLPEHLLRIRTPRKPVMIKLQLTGVKVVKLPYLLVTKYKRRNISWLLRESVDRAYGFDGSKWRECDGLWEKRDDAWERADIVLFDDIPQDMITLNSNPWDIL